MLVLLAKKQDALAQMVAEKTEGEAMLKVIQKAELEQAEKSRKLYEEQRQKLLEDEKEADRQIKLAQEKLLSLRKAREELPKVPPPVIVTKEKKAEAWVEVTEKASELGGEAYDAVEKIQHLTETLNKELEGKGGRATEEPPSIPSTASSTSPDPAGAKPPKISVQESKDGDARSLSAKKKNRRRSARKSSSKPATPTRS